MLTQTLIFLCFLVSLASCYSTGAPADACGTLAPNHGAIPQNKLPSPVLAPYRVTVTSNSVIANNQTVTVTLSGAEGRPFRGFIIVAEIFVNGINYRYGTWNSNDTLVKPGCGDGSGLTHNSGATKSTVVAQWTAPPAPFEGRIDFWATMVQTKPVFWTEIQGSSAVNVVAQVPTTSTIPPPTQTHSSTNFVPSSVFNGISKANLPSATPTNPAGVGNSSSSRPQHPRSLRKQLGTGQGQLNKRVGASSDNGGAVLTVSFICLLTTGIQVFL